MLDLIQVVQNHNATFYDFRTGHRQSRLTSCSITIVVAIILAILCKTPSNEFLNGIITSQAVLAGFGFNILFFLLSFKTKLNENSDFLEDAARADRISQLHKELFHNVSYFNLISIFSVSVALISLMPNIDLSTDSLLSKLSFKSFAVAQFKSYSTFSILVLQTIILALLYASLIESASTFLRTISRVTFFFRKIIE